MIKKSRDSIYGILQYELLIINSYFKVKTNEEENNMQNLGIVPKKGKNATENFSPPYQSDTLTIIFKK